ncbi:hypothetical protein ACWIE7_19055, partial [Dietzia sp. NPDC055343]
MAKRGFFAELNHQMKQAEKRRLQQEAAAVRAHNAAVREQERARRVAERARATANRAHAAELKATEREAKRLYVEARETEASALNSQLEVVYDQIDTLLSATLEIDDYVDLESLRSVPQHPPFSPGPLQTPIPEVQPARMLPPPVYKEPEPPKGLGGMFGGKKKYVEAVEASRRGFSQRMQAHAEYVENEKRNFREAVDARNLAEARRRQQFAAAKDHYEQECSEREESARQANAKLDELINNLAFDVPQAIEDYVGIVLANSVYPECFPVDYAYSFDLESRELFLKVFCPEPSSIPAVKEYRYVKSRDEITTTALSQKAQRDRYASAINETAVRTLHEIFEADRAAKIISIALTVVVKHVSPSTGLQEEVPLVQVGV